MNGNFKKGENRTSFGVQARLEYKFLPGSKRKNQSLELEHFRVTLLLLSIHILTPTNCYPQNCWILLRRCFGGPAVP